MKSSGILSLLQVLVIIVVTSILVTAANHHLALTAFTKLGEVKIGTVDTPSPRFPCPVRATQYTNSEDDDLDTL
jgi:hypothetical protein